mmetsp:Transcript_87317/g.264898  ORF Transcript_87317/g.264898 Transcript_87317/m.264898 type:complete len:541 (-) Transcript_87317:184-1806(-)
MEDAAPPLLPQPRDRQHRAWQAPRSRETSPGPPCDDLSPVSLATSGWGSSNSEEGAGEIVATLCGGGLPPLSGSSESWVDGIPCVTVLPWHGSGAVARARAALSADVDDPEELQLALLALEREAPDGAGVWAEVYESLGCELRLRLGALRADAAALLQSLLDGPLLPSMARHAGDSAVHERTAFVLHELCDGGAKGPARGGDAVHSAVDTVTTLCAVPDASEAPCGDVAALETAIELATSLGMDTGPAEERAASVRGLLSLRVAWGAFTRFCLLPIGISFTALMAEVARRFGLPASVGAGSSRGTPLFELCWREGSEVFFLRDQASWEQCLRRRGLCARPGRLELRLEAVAGVAPPPRRRPRDAAAPDAGQWPFVITGMRLAPSGTSSAGSGACLVRPHMKTGAAGKASPTPRSSMSARDRANRPVRPLPVGGQCRAAVGGRHRGQRRSGTGSAVVPPPGLSGISGGPVPGTAAVGAAAAGSARCAARGCGQATEGPALQLEGRGAQQARRGGLLQRCSRRAEAPTPEQRACGCWPAGGG